jgi:hypothetical protein
VEEHKDNRFSVDHLAWWEEAPLALALLAQSYVIGLWYYASIKGAWWALDLVVAIGAGLALDLIVVTTVMGRRAGRSSGWSWATSLGAFFCSALIALDRYGWEARSGLHVAFPLVVFLYSQHLAGSKRSATHAQAPPGATVTINKALDRLAVEGPQQKMLAELLASTSNGHTPLEATATRALDDLVTTVASQATFPCPHCGAALASKQALGAAVRNKHCPACKEK